MKGAVMPGNGKKSFVMYVDMYAPTSGLTREQKGELWDVVFQYNAGGEPKFSDPLVGMAFSFFRQAFDRDAAEYERRCRQNRENVRRRWKGSREDRGSEDPDNADDAAGEVWRGSFGGSAGTGENGMNERAEGGVEEGQKSIALVCGEGFLGGACEGVRRDTIVRDTDSDTETDKKKEDSEESLSVSVATDRETDEGRDAEEGFAATPLSGATIDGTDDAASAPTTSGPAGSPTASSLPGSDGTSGWTDDSSGATGPAISDAAVSPSTSSPAASGWTDDSSGAAGPATSDAAVSPSTSVPAGSPTFSVLPGSDGTSVPATSEATGPATSDVGKRAVGNGLTFPAVSFAELAAVEAGQRSGAARLGRHGGRVPLSPSVPATPRGVASGDGSSAPREGASVPVPSAPGSAAPGSANPAAPSAPAVSGDPSVPAIPRGAARDLCPQGRILEAYRQELPFLRQPRTVRPNVAAQVRARWHEKRKEGKFHDEDGGVAYFRRLFRYVAQNAFLSGRKTSWKADYEWLMKAANFDKVTTGKYAEDDER